MISVSIGSPRSDLIAVWEDLARRASSNVFLHPAALLAACGTGYADVRMLLAWDQTADAPRLVGVWALQRRQFLPFWPASLNALPYTYAFLSSPVVDPLFVDDVIPAFLQAIAGSDLPKVISLPDFNAESPSHGAIVAALAARGQVPLRLAERQRPVVSRAFGVKTSGSTRKKLRQDWKRLAALGTVDVVNDFAPAAVRLAFETFLALEAGSWKGEKGTALLSRPDDAAFVRRLIADLADQGCASVALLRVDGRAISAQVLMYAGTTAYTWKTAYDSGFARYSPGALLVDQVTTQLLDGPLIDNIDSCSPENGFMSQLWAGRRPMVDLLIDVGQGRSAAFLLEASRLRGYHLLRKLRDRFRQWRRP